MRAQGRHPCRRWSPTSGVRYRIQQPERNTDRAGPGRGGAYRQIPPAGGGPQPAPRNPRRRCRQHGPDGSGSGAVSAAARWFVRSSLHARQCGRHSKAGSAASSVPPRRAPPMEKPPGSERPSPRRPWSWRGPCCSSGGVAAVEGFRDSRRVRPRPRAAPSKASSRRARSASVPARPRSSGRAWCG